MMPFIFLHERWFVDMANLPPKDPFFTSWNDVNLAYSLAAIGFFILAIVIHFLIRNIKFTTRLRKIFTSYSIVVSVLLRAFTGIFLFFVSFIMFGEAWKLIAILGLTISLAFTTGIFLRTASFFGILLYFTSFIFFPPLTVLHYLFLLGIFLFFLISGEPSSPKLKTGFRFNEYPIVKILKKYQPYALAILRMTVGASIIIAALTNKIIDPRPALAFIAGKGEFLQSFIGMINMTVPQFILVAGLLELLAGTLLFFGFLTRLAGLFLLVMFSLGIFGLGITDFIGHLPLIAVSYAFLTMGGGEKLSFEKPSSLFS